MQLRKARKLTKTALARQIGRNARTIYRIEHEQANSTEETIRRLAAALGVPVTDLLAPDPQEAAR